MSQEHPQNPPHHENRAADYSAENSFSELEAELKDTKEWLLRTAAELENYRKRARRELEEQRKYAALPVMRDLLPVKDNLQRAVESAEQSSDSTSLLQGVRMILTQLDQALAAHGLVEIEGIGKPFDPQLHDAVSQEFSETHPQGVVCRVLEKGYRLHDQIVRPAKVVVSNGPAANENTSA